jgi:hypothetical protein
VSSPGRETYQTVKGEAMRLHAARDWPVIEQTCVNPLCCEHGVVQELPAFEEFGRLFLHDDQDIFCRECGEEMGDV